jgi:hypothetical protein
VIKGFEAVAKGEAQSISGITAERQDDRVQPHEACRRLPERLGMPAAARSRTR